MSILSDIFVISGYLNKTNVGILIKFTVIADQIHDIFKNVTGNQHKTIFFCCRHIRSLNEVHKTKNFIYMYILVLQIKSVALAQTSCTINYSVL